ncbi:MAG: murein biosynthesis integral membrane protein MurJ [Thermodesulfobacteriota bacterium]
MTSRPPGATGRRLVRATAVLFAARVASLLLALGQVVLLAQRFGTSAATDAFLVAETVHFFFLGVVEQNLNMVFVPVFVRYREEGDEESAWFVANTLLSAAILFLGLFALALVLFAPALTTLLAPGFSGEQRELAIHLMRLMAPLSLVMLAGAFFSTLAFACDRFALPAATSVLAALGGPAALLFATDFFGIDALAVGLLLGHLARLAVLFLTCPERHRLRWSLALSHPGVRQLGRMAGPRFLAVSLIQVNFMVDRYFASYLGPGSIAALAFGTKAVTAPVKLVVGSIGRAFMPTLSRLAARRELARIRDLLTGGTRHLAIILVPAIVFLAVFREDLLVLFFQRGAFRVESTQLTAQAVLFYSLGLFSYFLNPMLDGTFFSLHNSMAPLKVALFASLLNVALDALLVRPLGLGGIALATSLVVTVNTIGLWWAIQKEVGRLAGRPVLRSLAATALAALAMGLAFRWLDPWLLARGLTARLPRLLVDAGAGGLVYFGLQALGNRTSLGELARLFRRRQGNGPL